jgi:hypothetical protein
VSAQKAIRYLPVVLATLLLALAVAVVEHGDAPIYADAIGSHDAPIGAYESRQ